MTVLNPISNLKSEISNAFPSPPPPARPACGGPPDTRPAAGGALDTCNPPRFVVTLAADADATPLVRVPLAITGKWARGATRFEITRRDLEEIVRNFRQRTNGEVNVDYDHASEMPEVAAGGPIPSAGRIVRLDAPEVVSVAEWKVGSKQDAEGSQLRIADGLLPTGREAPGSQPRYVLWGWYEPTERARGLVKSREYRYISPAIDWTARSKLTGKAQGTTLTSVALTNRPFLEELPQIRLSDPGFQLVGEPSRVPREGGVPSDPHEDSEKPPHSTGGPMKQVTLSVSDGKIIIHHEDFKDQYFAEPEDLTKCLEALGMPTTQAALSDAAAAMTLAQAGALLSEAEARGRFIPAAEFFRARVEEELEDAVRAGKILPRQRDDWRRIALADFPTFRKVLAAQKPQVPLRPVGFAGTGPADVQTQVKFLAEQRMRERGISFGQALSEIGREQPDLVQQYRRAVSSSEF